MDVVAANDVADGKAKITTADAIATALVFEKIVISKQLPNNHKNFYELRVITKYVATANELEGHSAAKILVFRSAALKSFRKSAKL